MQFVAKNLSKCQLDVVSAPPILRNTSSSFILLREGDKLQLFCDGFSNPKPIVTWYKDGREFNLSVGDTVQHIESVRHTDGGVYTCNFKNPIGQASYTIKVVIEGQFIDQSQVLF